MVISGPEVSHISILGPILPPMKRGSLQSYTGKYRYSGELRHGTCHFYTMYTGISKIHSVYGNLKLQMKLDLCICEALSYRCFHDRRVMEF